ncbi:MAG: BMP family ABC transporter substrate-binding protein [Terrisporobacter othiniensis]|uniref:BMP family lipoprotein n=1 Tax=Terrisporobacter petrolearius TaxID=1460447 RepID=UPI0008F037DF|nr:BMP family ABC transporter substrate-binding protein [Terrisporobacter petrolearius]MDU4862269.1 BMP family ABC transporter substrate-binding protein [Terrisporobacter othiniensis]MDU6993723.1 BMP family ABC transporter substrate-binding protein [Terrisporobacter othiniensis]SFJ17260.1 basic membrane protein A [Terrisporobacter glycolicus]
MKKILSILLSCVLGLGLVACSSSSNETSSEGKEIAMITDIGTIDDKSFNQGTWEGIEAYAKEHNISHEYYKPTEQSTDAYLAAIELAVKGGAKVVVTPGFLFEEPIYIAQDKYPDVHFILIDGNPHDKDMKDYKTNKNTVGIVFAEEQSGYLAGYAAVKEGYTKLGFMGGMAVPAVTRFGYGFVQGADAAAKELKLDKVDIKYHYTGGFDATPEVQTLASSWYTDGTEVIFAAGGAVGNSVMSAAESIEGKKVIGVDVDQSSESNTVITSAMKGLSSAVEQTLDAYYNNKFPGGQSLVLGADKDGVMLPMETSKFEKFTKADYDKVYKNLADGKIKLQKDDIQKATDLNVSVVSVKVVK